MRSVGVDDCLFRKTMGLEKAETMPLASFLVLQKTWQGLSSQHKLGTNGQCYCAPTKSSDWLHAKMECKLQLWDVNSWKSRTTIFFSHSKSNKIISLPADTRSSNSIKTHFLPGLGWFVCSKRRIIMCKMLGSAFFF